MYPIRPLSEVTLKSAIALVNRTFPRQPLLERADLGLRVSLMSGRFAKTLLRIAGIRSVRYWVVVEPHSGKVIGISGLYVRADDPESAWLGWTCVRMGFRGQSIGKTLVQCAIAEARRQGKRSLKLYTSDEPEFAIAQKMYTGFGFQVIDKKPLPGGKFNRIYCELKLY